MSVEAERAEAERQLERRAIDIVDRYAGSLKRSKGENDARKADRDKIEQMGRNPKAFQHAVMLARTMSRRDAEAYLEDVAWFAKILLGRQGDLFSDELEKINKREAKKQAATAENAPGGRSQAELDANTDQSQRSAPEAGGAKPQVPVENPPDEQQAGDDALKAMTPQTQKAKAGKPKSQSQQAAEKREAAAAKPKGNLHLVN